MISLHNFFRQLDFSKLVAQQRSRDGLTSLTAGVAAGLALGYFSCVCVQHSAQSSDEADMRRKRVGVNPADVTVPDSVCHKLGWHTNSRGMVMCHQQFLPKGGVVKAVVGLCHGFSDHSHGFLMDFAIKLCIDGFAVIIMDVEGHGLSDGLHCAIHDVKNMAIDLSDHFLEQLTTLHFEDKPFFIYGVSMGGANVFNMCTIPQCKALQERISGAIMCAPMVKIADEMKPPAFVISLLGWLGQIIPHAPITPIPEILSKCFRDSSVYIRAKKHPLLYSKKPRVLTGLTMLNATDDINDRMEELTAPLLLLHGADDVVTDPKLSQVLYDRCSSKDKKINIYPQAWHDMLAGEPEDMRKRVYGDIVAWINDRC
mmetsp:Transcript_6211/g.10151  ORF Transcript_6211/g.10151 Transcript_6211/m.10151 type:complete len:370 (+) Transcript_6211:94-1203(+)